MCCIAAIALALVARVHGAVSVDGAAVAVVLEALGAVRAVLFQTAACLGTDADARALLDVLDVLSDLDGFADDLMTNNASCRKLDRRMWRRWGDVRYGVGPQPEESMCKSEPQIPQCEISMSTSSSLHFLGSKSPHCILPLTASLSFPSHPWNFVSAMLKVLLM
jgi:hypothetical protein